MRNAAPLLWALLACAACAQAAEPAKLKDALTGDAKGSAAANPQCQLFSPAEISTYLGVSVGPGKNAAGGAGCQWTDKNDDGRTRTTRPMPSSRWLLRSTTRSRPS